MGLRLFIIIASLAIAPLIESAAACSVNDLVGRVKMLDPGRADDPKAESDFTDINGVYHRPTPLGTSPPSNYLADLRSAFGLAARYSPDFQNALCELDFIFIDQNSDDGAPIGWGFWEGPNQGPATGKIQAIGISERPWQPSTSFTFTGLTSVETFLAQKLLPPGLPLYYYKSADQNTREMGLLGILVHEMGHISYRDGDAIPDECFERNGWRPGGVIHKRVAFKKFRQSQGDHRYSRYPVIAGLVASGTPNNINDAYRRIGRIYDNGNFASLLATLSPEEDFAETLKLAVLHQVGLMKLKASVDGADTNVVKPLNDRNGGLYDKATCLWSHLVPSPALP